MRRRDLLSAALCAATLTGCSALNRVLPGTGPVTEATAPAPAAPRPGPPRPGTPAEIAARSTVPVLCYHQVREPTAADGPGAVTSYGAKDWAVQLEEPRAQLAAIVGHEVELFAYPYGAWNRAALPHVQAAGYRAAFQLTDQPADADLPLLTIRRVLTRPTWDVPTLLARLAASTGRPAVHRGP